MHFKEGMLLDGCHISLNSSMLLFEDDWKKAVIDTMSNSLIKLC
jgi:hypothetical protein